MRKFRAFRSATLALLGAATAGLAAMPAIAQADGGHWPLPAIIDSSSCSDPVLTQALLGWGDQNLYALAPGQSADSFDGSGWTLTGDARIVPADLFDGQSGPVLDLPSGSAAISPEVCVNSTYQTARIMVRSVGGSGDVSFFVASAGMRTRLMPQNVGTQGASDSWTLSDPLNLQPDATSGWQVVRFAFVGGAQDSETQLYDFYLDPYRRG